MQTKERLCLSRHKVALTKEELEKKGGLCFFCLLVRTLELRNLSGDSGIPFVTPEECGRDSLDIMVREAIQMANNTQKYETDDETDEDIDESLSKERENIKKRMDSTDLSKNFPKEQDGELRPLSMTERREIYAATGCDPGGIFLEPRVLRVFGASSDVKLELTLPMISKDASGKDFEPQYIEVLQRTLDFINHINVFGRYHPNTLPQLVQFLKGSTDSGPHFG